MKHSKEKFTKRDKLNAGIVRRFQHVVGHPSDETMSHSATTNGIKNSHVTGRDVSLAREMLGPSKHETQVKFKPDVVDITL